jgi:hypothetical protein
MSKVKDLTGHRSGRLEALRLSEIRKGRTYWMCLCKPEWGGCGKEVEIRADSLQTGNTQSCGCQKIDSATKHGHNRSAKGGHKPSRTYNSWQSMKQRCYYEQQDSYAYYGAVGVTVCDRWLGENGFENFLSDLGERPAKHTLDRFPDRDGNYEPGNCRWATPQQQAWNRSSNRIITIDGESHCVGEWAVLKGIPRTVIQDRLALGWGDRIAVLTPYTPRH